MAPRALYPVIALSAVAGVRAQTATSTASSSTAAAATLPTPIPGQPYPPLTEGFWYDNAVSDDGYETLYSTTWDPNNLPDTSQPGQAGTNLCTEDSQDSQCQVAWINSLEDFCLWSAPEPDSAIGDIERIAVAWCNKPGHGTRLIPDGTITGAHFVVTPDYVQISGQGELRNLNIIEGDQGGEMDPHGADGNGNPIGGIVFTTAFTGEVEQVHEWNNFMSAKEFCLRACRPGPMAAVWCEHIYDVEGCWWNHPGNYSTGFDQCEADSGEPAGLYPVTVDGEVVTSTFLRARDPLPTARPAPPRSQCQEITTFSAVGVEPSVAPPSATGGSGSPAGMPPRVIPSGTNNGAATRDAEGASAEPTSDAVKFGAAGVTLLAFCGMIGAALVL